MTDQDKPTFDPLREMVKAEENLMGFRQNLIQKVWEASVKAAETGEQADVDAVIRLHAGIKAIDYAMAQKPSAYRYMTPI